MHDPPAPLAGAPPRLRRLAIGAAVGLAGVEAVAVALSPWLLVEHPLWLVALSPSVRHIALAVLEVPLPLIVLVATLRRVLALSVLWLIGAIYGRAAIAWSSVRFPRVTRFMHWTEGLLQRFGLPLLVVAPGFTPSMLAGVGGIRFLPFVAAITLGNAFYCTLNVLMGEAIGGWTRPLFDWLAAHVVPATVVCAIAVLIQQLWSRWRRRSAGVTAQAKATLAAASEPEP